MFWMCSPSKRSRIYFRFLFLGLCAISVVSFLVFSTNLEVIAQAQQQRVSAIEGLGDTRTTDILYSRLEKVLQRLGKVEKVVAKLSALQPQPVKARRNDGLKAGKRKCPIPSDWRYPFCEDKVEWIRRLWQSNTKCYVDTHGVDPVDDCTILRFLSEAEAWCPLQAGRERLVKKVTPKKPANIQTDLKGLLSILKHSSYKWMRERATRMWPMWIEAAESLKKRNAGIKHGRTVKNIMLLMGSFIVQPNFFYFAYHGGPLGEMVQWTDLMASLYILGHNIVPVVNKTDLDRLLNRPPVARCASKMVHDFDLLFEDYNGHAYLHGTVGPNHSQYRCRERILDSFGTEAEFNLAEYGGTVPGGRSVWANADVNLPQIMTMYPHSPDNTFLGFVVDGPVPRNAKALKRKPIGLVYGKEARFWKSSRRYLDTLNKYLDIHATVASFGAEGKKFVPSYVINHGYLHSPELLKLLDKTKVFIGLGFPYEGPAPLEAIARGCVFLNPKFDPPHNRLNNGFFKSKPTLRSVTSQNPYAEQFIGKPHVYTVDMNNSTALEAAIKDILRQKVKPYLPFEWTPAGMLERVNAFVEHMDYCNSDAKPWPPRDQMQVWTGKAGQSCKDVCFRHGLLCEPSYFVAINTVDKIQGLDVKCKKVDRRAVLQAPYYTADQTCVLQTHPLLFSCVYSEAQSMRVCPCRDYQPQQVALCKKCS